MINLSAKNVVKTAIDTGFIKDNVEKVMRLIDILETLFSSKWKDKLVLKGGTAINLFYMNLPRLSVDIDLDYIGIAREEMLEDKALLKDYLENILFQKGYSLSSASKSYFALDSYVFRYTNNGGNLDNIKVEINFLDRVHILPETKKTINVLGYNGDVQISTLDKYELYGSKLAALLGRSKPRDIYDVYTAINSDLLTDTELLKKCFIFYNCLASNAVAEIDCSILDGVTAKDISRTLQPVLLKGIRFDLKSAVQKLKEYLDVTLIYSDSEKQFVENFKCGKYTPKLLFDNEEVLSRIKQHPMALWRCSNK